MRQGEQLLNDDLVGNGVLAIAPDQRSVFFTSIRFREPPDRAAARLAPDVALEPRADYIRWAVVFPKSRRDFSEITASGPALQGAAEELATGFHDDFRQTSQVSVDLENLRTDGKRMALIADGCYLGSLLSVGLGITFLLVAGSDEPTTEEILRGNAPQVSLTPMDGGALFSFETRWP